MALQFPSDRTEYLGLIRFTPEEDDGGSGEQIELYLPTALQFGDKVEYENIGIGGIFANAADAYTGQRDLQSYSDFASDLDFGNVAKLGVSKLVNTFSDKAGAAARDATRLAPNPNTRAIFKQVSLRQFQMTFKLIPNNEFEANIIKSIIMEFRKRMYPEEIEGNFGYKFPTRYKIETFYDSFLQNQTEQCYLESLMTNYNPSSHAFMKTGANSQAYFSEIDLSLTFMEGRTLNRKSIEAGF